MLLKVQSSKWDLKILAVVDRWSTLVVSPGLSVHLFFTDNFQNNIEMFHRNL